MIQNEGPGWRFQRDTSRKKFTILLGGDGWAVELTEDEWNSLCPLLLQLIDQYDQSKILLMKEEKINIEIEKNQWWACIEGDRYSWSLSLILSGEDMSERGVELYWPVPAAHAVTSVMRLLWNSEQ